MSTTTRGTPVSNGRAERGGTGGDIIGGPKKPSWRDRDPELSGLLRSFSKLSGVGMNDSQTETDRTRRSQVGDSYVPNSDRHSRPRHSIGHDVIMGVQKNRTVDPPGGESVDYKPWRRSGKQLTDHQRPAGSSEQYQSKYLRERDIVTPTGRRYRSRSSEESSDSSYSTMDTLSVKTSDTDLTFEAPSTPSGSTTGRGLSQQGERSRFLRTEVSEDRDRTTGRSVCEKGRWVGRGFTDASITFTDDRGYLLWNEPKGSMDVYFRYNDTQEEFSCFIDPQYLGVKVYVFNEFGRKEVVVDGLENPFHSASPHHKRSPSRNLPENNFELKSYSGQVKLRLEALGTKIIAATTAAQSFKINYTLTL